VTNLRLWISILACVAFALGLGSGLWLSASLFRPAPERGPFADYEQMLVRTFDLSPERARLLGVVLASYDRELQAIKDRHTADYMSAMEPELRARGLYYTRLIQEKVLPERERAEFERLALGLP
jgi:hypothetical protein